MNFVFYDTETTGLDTTFDQILQFAAILTDADLNGSKPAAAYLSRNSL
jgi:exodeoxyribonuclease-1